MKCNPVSMHCLQIYYKIRCKVLANSQLVIQLKGSYILIPLKNKGDAQVLEIDFLDRSHVNSARNASVAQCTEEASSFKRKS